MRGRCAGRVLWRAGSATALAAVLLTAAACDSSDTSPEAPAAATKTAASSDTSPAAPKTAASTSPTAVASPSTTAEAPKVAKVKVPSGVGLDYQSAQDQWRAAGLHVAPAKDATGAHRIPVIDSNWIVVSQSPKAGATVDEGSFITATVKKSTDG